MSEHVTIIQPSTKWQFIDLAELWRYRELLYAFIKRDITSKYRQTLIGGGWAILQPLATMVVFSFFFGKLAKMPSDGVPYPIFSYAGLLLWTYFSGAIGGSANSMVMAGGLITKVYFPRIMVPLTAAIQYLVDYAVAAIILLVLMVLYRIPFTLGLLALPIIALLTCLLASGIGFFLSAINVKFRDVRFVMPFFIQLMLYVTPVIYPASVADRFRFVLLLNPMTGYIETHRALILGQPIMWHSLGISVLLTILFFVGGAFYFRKTERGFADII